MVRALLQSLIKQTESHIKYDDPQERRFSKDEILNRQAAGSRLVPATTSENKADAGTENRKTGQKSTQESCRKPAVTRGSIKKLNIKDKGEHSY